MAEKAEILKHLRLVTGARSELSQEPILKAPGMPQGIRTGIIAELLGTAPCEWVIELLALNPEHPVFWSERDSRVLPTAIFQRGVAENQIKFGWHGTNLTTSVGDLLKSQVYKIIVAPSAFSDLVVLQRFMLATKSAGCNLFLIAQEEDEPSSAWPIKMQLEIHRGQSEGSFRIEVLKQKHGWE